MAKYIVPVSQHFYIAYICLASLSLLREEAAHARALRKIVGYRGTLRNTSCTNFRACNFPPEDGFNVCMSACKTPILAHFCQADSPSSAHLKVGKGKAVFAVSKVLPLDTFSRSSGREEKKKSVESNALPATN